MNSLVEKYLFEGDLSAELDELDLSFFEKDKSESEVKKFANRISFMKVSTRASLNSKDRLLNAAKNLKLKIQEYSSDRNMNIEKDISTETLFAIEEGNINTLDTVINTLNINNCYNLDLDGDPLNYISLSIYYKSMNSLKYFVEKGADIENVCENKTPLMFAVKYGQLDMVKYLIDNGAKLITVSNEGRTALDYAKIYEQPEIEKLLRELIKN